MTPPKTPDSSQSAKLVGGVRGVWVDIGNIGLNYKFSFSPYNMGEPTVFFVDFPGSDRISRQKWMKVRAFSSQCTAQFFVCAMSKVLSTCLWAVITASFSLQSMFTNVFLVVFTDLGLPIYWVMHLHACKRHKTERYKSLLKHLC